MIKGDQNLAPSGSSMLPPRRAAKAPSFIKPPAWNMETAVGAATWPSGDQLWKGNRPPRTAKPRKTNGNHRRWNAGEKEACSSSSMLNVPMPEAKYIANAPTSDTTDPMKRYSVSFIAAYSRVTFQPQMAIRRYMGKTAI